MTLTNLLRNKTGAWVLGAALTACADTYNNTYVMGGKEGENAVELNTCEDVANRWYECDPQGFVDYEKAWGLSIQWQLEHAVRECSATGHDYFGTSPDAITCLEQKSCADINAGACDQYFSNN